MHSLHRAGGRVAFVAALLIGCPAFGWAQMDGSEYVRIEVGGLLKTHLPTTVRIPVTFTLAEGWHIYWKNPGDSGAPPQLKWTLPEGYKVTGMQWPVPHVIKAGELASYGYDGEATFLVEIEGPTGANEDSEMPFTLDAHYLVCKDLCLPGDTQVKGVIKTSENVGPLFARATYPLPREAKTASVKTEGNTVTYSFEIHGRPLDGYSKVYFFPAEGATLDHASPQTWAYETQTGILTVTAKKSSYAEGPITQVKGVLFLEWTDRTVAVLHRKLAFEYSETKTQENPE